MAYIATKPIRFDKEYFIGDLIPGDVVMPGMAASLTAMGMIVEVDHVDIDSSGGANTVEGENVQLNEKEAAEGGEGDENAQPQPKKRGKPKEA